MFPWGKHTFLELRNGTLNIRRYYANNKSNALKIRVSGLINNSIFLVAVYLFLVEALLDLVPCYVSPLCPWVSI